MDNEVCLFYKPCKEILKTNVFWADDYAIVEYKNYVHSNKRYYYIDKSISGGKSGHIDILPKETLYSDKKGLLLYYKNRIIGLCELYRKDTINHEFLAYEVIKNGDIIDLILNHYVRSNKKTEILYTGMYDDEKYILVNIGLTVSKSFLYFLPEKEFLVWKLKN